MRVEEIVRRVRDRSDRLASGLPVPAAPIGSDFSLSGIVPVPDTWKPASVLVPLVNRAPGVTVLVPGQRGVAPEPDCGTRIFRRR